MTDGPAVQGFNVDIPDGAFDGPAETPEGPAAEAAEAVTSGDLALDHAETPEVEAPEASAEAPAEPDMFPRSAMEEVRRESAGYRTKAKPFTDAFEGIEEADRDVFLGLANLYKTDPIAAGREMARLAEGLTADAPDEAAAPDGEKLTPYMTETRYAEIKRQEAVEAAATQIETDAKGLGYAKGTPKYTYLLATAQTKGGDLNAAHAAIEAERMADRAAYVAEKEQEAAGAPTAPADVSVPVSGERQLKSWRDVEDAIDELF